MAKGKGFPISESRRTKDISPKVLRAWKNLRNNPDASVTETLVVAGAGDAALATVVIRVVEGILVAMVIPGGADEETGTVTHAGAAIRGGQVVVQPAPEAPVVPKAPEVQDDPGGRADDPEGRVDGPAVRVDVPEGRAGDRNEEQPKKLS